MTFSNLLRLGAMFVGCALIGMTRAAHATEMQFSYAASVGTIGGIFDGTLAADGQHFTVTGYEDLTFDGAPVNIAITILSSFDAYFNGIFHDGKGYNGNGTPVVTLNGSYMDIMVTTAGAVDGFTLEHNDRHYGANGSVSSGPSFGGDQGENFNVADWSASIVPEPSSFWILLVATPLLAWVRRSQTLRGGYRQPPALAR